MRYILAVAMMALIAGSAHAEDWPRWRGAGGDGEWRGLSLATKLDSPTLPVIWRGEIGGGYSGITVADGLAYTMDRPGGDDGPADAERILCFDAATGKQLWAHRYATDYGDLAYNNGPRASVTIHEGKAYALGAVGHVHCLDAATGKVIWSIDAMKDLHAERPIWGFAGSPVIFEDLVLLHLGVRPVGSLIACNKETSAVVWKADGDAAAYATPIVIDHPAKGGTKQIIHWSPKHIMGIDPRDGSIQWKHPYDIQYGVAIADPIYHDGLLFISAFWHGAKALRLPPGPGAGAGDAQLVWSDQHEIRGLMAGPLYRDGHGYILDRSFGLTCFEYGTGKKLWDDGNKMTPRAQHPHATLIGLAGTDRALALNEKGELIHLRLSPGGYEELWRAKIIDDTWAHPAPTGQHLIARSDTQIVCVQLPAD